MIDRPLPDGWVLRCRWHRGNWEYSLTHEARGLERLWCFSELEGMLEHHARVMASLESVLMEIAL